MVKLKTGNSKLKLLWESTNTWTSTILIDVKQTSLPSFVRVTTWTDPTKETLGIQVILVLYDNSCPVLKNKVYEREGLKQCWFTEILKLHL